jgi:hypothetical protein
MSYRVGLTERAYADLERPMTSLAKSCSLVGCVKRTIWSANKMIGVFHAPYKTSLRASYFTGRRAKT